VHASLTYRTRHQQSRRVLWAGWWSREGQSCDDQLMVDWRERIKDHGRTSPQDKVIKFSVTTVTHRGFV